MTYDPSSSKTGAGHSRYVSLTTNGLFTVEWKQTLSNNSVTHASIVGVCMRVWVCVSLCLYVWYYVKHLHVYIHVYHIILSSNTVWRDSIFPPGVMSISHFKPFKNTPIIGIASGSIQLSRCTMDSQLAIVLLSEQWGALSDVAAEGSWEDSLRGQGEGGTLDL